MITFEYGSLSLSLRPAEFSDTYESQHMQARGRTHDGELIVGDKNVSIIRFQLEWRVLDDDDKDDIESFFSASNVNGSMNTFHYTDHNGTRWAVRLVNDVLDWVNYYTGCWSVQMLLEVVEDEAGS